MFYTTPKLDRLIYSMITFSVFFFLNYTSFFTKLNPNSKTTSFVWYKIVKTNKIQNTFVSLVAVEMKDTFDKVMIEHVGMTLRQQMDEAKLG